MGTVRPSGLSGLFPASSGSYCEADSGYQGITSTNYRSVSLWVKVPTVSGVPLESTTGSLVYWGDETGTVHGRTWSIELKNGKPRLWIKGAHTTVDRELEGERSVVDDGEWHLLTFQFQQGTAIEDVEIWIDDTGPLDTKVFGMGTTINTSTSSPVTLNGRNRTNIHYSVERELILEQVALWEDPLDPGDISFIWNRGRGTTDIVVTGTDGQAEKQISPAALSGTIALDAWWSFDSPREFTTQIYDVTDNPSRSLGVFNGMTWIYDTPASGTGFLP